MSVIKQNRVINELQDLNNLDSVFIRSYHKDVIKKLDLIDIAIFDAPLNNLNINETSNYN